MRLSPRCPTPRLLLLLLAVPGCQRELDCLQGAACEPYSFLLGAAPQRDALTLLNQPESVALSGDRLYVADLGNDRVLVFTIPTYSGAAAAQALPVSRPRSVAVAEGGRFLLAGSGDGLVLWDRGAPGGSTPRTTIIGPTGGALLRQPYVSVAGGRVLVSDSGNHRLLSFPSADLAALPQGATARLPMTLLGQTDLAAVQPNAGRGKDQAGKNGFEGPTSATLDGPDADPWLYVADTGNQRVSAYQNLGGAAARDATQQLTQAGGVALTLPRALAVGEGNLALLDQARAQALLFTRPGAARLSGAADGVAGGPGPLAAETLRAPHGVALDGGLLAVADTGNQRVLLWSGWRDRLPTLGPAGLVLGQPGFGSNVPNNLGNQPRGLSNPQGLAGIGAGAGATLVVCDSGNSRVLLYRPLPVGGAAAAPVLVLGQASAEAAVVAGPSETTLASPRGAFLDARGLLVADTGNHRVLSFPNAALVPGPRAASGVLGQAGLRLAENPPAPSATRLKGPQGVTRDARSIYVADTGHHRVLRFDVSAPGDKGEVAQLVLGQPGMTSASVVSPPTLASLNAPEAVAVAPGGELLVADTGNNRLLLWEGSLASGAEARAVLPPPGARVVQSLERPGAVLFGPDGALYVADSGNRRVLRWESLAEARAGRAPLVLDSRASSFSVPVFTDGSVPQGLFVSERLLYVSDSANHRVAAIALPLR